MLSTHDLRYRKRFTRHLFPGETVHWTGKPAIPEEIRQPIWKKFKGLTALLVIVAVASPLSFWLLTHRVNIELTGTSLTVLYLLRLLTHRFGSDMFYAITDKRILIKNPMPGQKLAALELAAITPKLGKLEWDGSGAIAFEGSEYPIFEGLSASIDLSDMQIPGIEDPREIKLPRSFIGVPNAREVCGLIERLKREQPRS